MIQAKFKELTVLGLHDDITITAHRRQDFGKLMEAAKVMKPVLFGQLGFTDEYGQDEIRLLRRV